MKNFKFFALLLILVAILTGYWAMVRELKQKAVQNPVPTATPSVSAAPISRSISSEKIEPDKRAREISLAKSNNLAKGADLHLVERSESLGSIQYHYEQRHLGVSLYPRKGLTLTLTKDATLLRSDEWLQKEIKIVNHVSLAPDQARVIAFQTVIQDNVKLKISAPMNGGTAVIWTSPSEIARHAYLFNSRGIEIVVDAQSGAILSKRNRRME